jgi:hypothetical protein
MFEWEKVISNSKHEFIDMNCLSNTREEYDFIWTNSSIEHLGCIDKSIDFVLKSLSYLKVGGYAIHTTEFNWHDNQLFDNEINCCFNKTSLEKLFRKVNRLGHKTFDIDFSLGEFEEDKFIDVHPFNFHIKKIPIEELNGKSHFKLKIKNKFTTSVGFIIFKSKKCKFL